MARKTKLTEKGSRFTSALEEKLKADFKKYQEEITVANIETARSFRFMKLLSDWFSEARPTFVEEYLKGLEKYVTMEQKDLVVAGRIDALYGNVIIEFESNLEKKKKEAETQLRKYLFSLLGSKEKKDINFLCIASDGMIFQVYTPWWADSQIFPERWEDIELKLVDRVDFLKLDGGLAFLWLDRYLFRKTLLHPTSEEFVRDFGINSPAYAFAIKLLQSEWKRVAEQSEFRVIYENWEKYLRIAYGTSVADTELFLRHTYLGTFVRLLTFMRFNQEPTIPTTKDVEEVFTGRFFQKLGIQNFLEEDLD